MSINIGTPDRILRIIIGLLLILAPFVTTWSIFTNPIWTWGAVIVGAVMIATASLRYCPAYGLFGLTTIGKRQK